MSNRNKQLRSSFTELTLFTFNDFLDKGRISKNDTEKQFKVTRENRNHFQKPKNDSRKKKDLNKVFEKQDKRFVKPKQDMQNIQKE